MSRHPRAVQELMKGEVMVLIPGYAALRRLTDDCHFPEEKARRLLNIAWEFGQKAEPCPGGYVHIWYHGEDDTGTHVYSVVEHIGNPQGKGLAAEKESGYTQGKTDKPGRSGKAAKNPGKDQTMPARTRRTAPEPEVAEQNGDEVDFTRKLTAPISATMADYAEWLDANVPGWDKAEVDRIAALSVQLYSYFQKSDFNIERRAERKAQREAAAPEPSPEPETAPPARSGRGGTRAKPAAAKPTPAKPGRSGKAPGRAAASARTRATAPAGDAPF